MVHPRPITPRARQARERIALSRAREALLAALSLRTGAPVDSITRRRLTHGDLGERFLRPAAPPVYVALFAAWSAAWDSIDAAQPVIDAARALSLEDQTRLIAALTDDGTHHG